MRLHLGLCLHLHPRLHLRLLRPLVPLLPLVPLHVLHLVLWVHHLHLCLLLQPLLLQPLLLRAAAAAGALAVVPWAGLCAGTQPSYRGQVAGSLAPVLQLRQGNWLCPAVHGLRARSCGRILCTASHTRGS